MKTSGINNIDPKFSIAITWWLILTGEIFM